MPETEWSKLYEEGLLKRAATPGDAGQGMIPSPQSPTAVPHQPNPKGKQIAREQVAVVHTDEPRRVQSREEEGKE